MYDVLPYDLQLSRNQVPVLRDAHVQSIKYKDANRITNLYETYVARGSGKLS